MLTTLALTLAPFLTADPEDRIDYEGILAQARERYGLEAQDLSAYSIDALLDRDSFAKAEIGPFDLRLPVHEMEDKGGADLMREATTNMLDLLEVWAEWTRVDKDAVDAIHSDIGVLRKWVKSWSNRNFKKALNEEGDSLFERMKTADDGVRAAGRRLAEALSPRFDPEVPGKPAQIVLAPTRETFAELSTLVGAIEATRKEILWGPDAVFHSAAWGTEVQVVALEYAHWPWDTDHPFNGDSMNGFVKTGRRQHVVDRAAASLTRAVFNSIASPLVEQALKTNLLIEVVGEERPTFSSWSFNFSRAGGSTAPYSRFVPGGNSAGGTLPARPASAGPTTGSTTSSEESPYRDKNGRDHFMDPLAKGQKRGFKLAARDPDIPSDKKRDRLAHFAVGILGKSEAVPVTAPFLGDAAEDKPTPPNEFIDEYEEFFRAYRSGFLHWLRTEGQAEDEAASPAAFARLLERLRTRSKSDTLSSMVGEVYGIPLSGVDGETDSLEWRFLARVSK